MFAHIFNQFIYRPEITVAPNNFSPTNLSLEYEDLKIRTEDRVEIHGWYLPAETPTHSILYLHGNGGDCRDWVNVAPRFVENGFNLLLIDYRGYGKSGGRPTERGLYKDGEAALDWLQKRANDESVPIAIMGKSLGSGVATYIAAQDANIASLVLDSAFTSMREVIQYNAPWLPKIVVPKMYDSFSRASRIACPTLMVHGDRDEIVPIAQAQALYRKLTCKKLMGVIRGAGHNNIDSTNRYYYWVLNFLRAPLDFMAAREAKI